MRRLHFWQIAAVMVVCTVSSSTPIPVLDVTRLVAEADLIGVGEVLNITEIGEREITINGTAVTSTLFEGNFRLDQVLKGSADRKVLDFEFEMPSVPTGHRGAPSAYRMLFLSIRDGKYTFTSPYYPSLIAVPGLDTSDARPEDGVSQQLTAVITSPLVPEVGKLEAVQALATVRTTGATATLKQVALGEALELKVIATAALLRRNESSAVGIAESVLLPDYTPVPVQLQAELQYAIQNSFSNPEGIPSLSRLLRAKQPATRRAATMALRNTASVRAVDGLTRSLWDTDFETRYYAVVGLAEITQDLEWRPLFEQFRSDEARYLAHWRWWAQTLGSGSIPPKS